MKYKAIITLFFTLLCYSFAQAQDPSPILVHAVKNQPFTFIEEKLYDGTNLASGRDNLFIIKDAQSIVNDGDEVYVETVLRYMTENYDTGEWLFVTEPGAGYSIFGFNTLAGKDKDKYELAEEDKKMLVCDAYASIKMIPLTITPPEGTYTYGESEIGKDIKATIEPEQPGFFEYLVFKTSSYVKIAVGALLEVGENLLQIWYRIDDNAHYKAEQKETTITVEPKTIDYEGELIINSKPKDGTTNFIPAQIEKLPVLKGIIDDDDVQLAFDFENSHYPSANPGEYTVTINLKLIGNDAGNYKLSNNQETVTVKIEKEEKKTVELEGNFAIYPRYFDNTTNVYEGEVTVPTIKNKTEGDDVKIAVDYTQTAFPDAAIGEHLVKIVYYLDGKDAYKYKLAKTSQYEYGEIKAYKIAINQTPDSKGVYQLEYTQSEIGFDLRIDNISNENETAKYFVNGEDVTGKMLTAGAYTIKAVMYQYNLQVAEAEWKVNVKKLKLKITDPQVQHTKVYDGTKSVELIGNQCEITNSLESDNIKIASQTQEYDSPEIGTGKKITVSFTISGDLTDKYTAPDNVVYNDGVISPGKIEVSDIKVIKTDYCQGEEAKIVLTISDGVPQTAAITFDNEAKQNGFTDLEINNLTTESDTEKSFTLTIPETAGGGTHNGEITLSDPLGTVSQKYSFSIIVNYPSNYIVSKFTDVVLVNNYSEQFTDYQWFKNGEKIEGATLQFYCDPNGISGIYSVEAGTVQGSKVKICGAEFTAEEQAVTKSLVKKVEVYPNPATSLHPINVQLVNLSENEIKNANMVIINSIGNKVMQLKDLSEEFEISLPKGSYTITIFFNQHKISTKVIVNN